MIGHQFSKTVLKYGLACFGLAFLLQGVAHAECYTYDDLGRLITTEYDDNQAKREYLLDEHGNRVTVDVTTTNTLVCDEPTGVTSTGEDAPYVYTSGTSSSSSSGTSQIPVADDENISLLVGETFVVKPLEGDTDPDGDDDDLFIAGISSNSSHFSTSYNTGSVTVTTISEGVGTIDYTVSDLDGNTDTGKISVTVSIVDPNLPPNQCSSDPNAPGCQ